MVAVESQMMPLGTPMPEFSLPAPDGAEISTRNLAASQPRAYVVMFICNHCPFVKHLHEGLAQFGRDYQDKDVAIVAINANDVEKYPDDSPAKMAEEIENVGYTFPYLYDATQEVAKAYHAACTPDFYVFDADRKLVYRGQFDESRPDSGIPVTGQDLRAAVDAVLAGETPTADQTPSIGCNIKWKPGNEPAYFPKG